MSSLVCELLKNLGVFNLETRCAYKDEKGIAFYKGCTQFTELMVKRSWAAFFLAVCISQSDRNRI